MFKRYMAVLVALCFMLTIAAGCSGNTNSDGSTAGSESQGTTQATAGQNETEASEEVTLTLWDDIYGDSPDWDNFFKEIYADFQAKYPNIKVNRLNSSKGGPNGGAMNVVAALAAGTGPDLMDWVDVRTYAAKGYIAPLDDYLANWEDAKDLNPAIMQYFKYGGKVYALPSMFNFFSPRCIFYRKDIAQDIGLDVSKEPATWAEFEVWAKAFAENGYKIGIHLDADRLKAFILANGGSIDAMNADGTVRCTLNTPENIKTVTWLQGLAKQKFIDTTLLIDDEEGLDAYITGKYGMLTQGFPQIHRKFLPAGMKDEEIGYFLYPGEQGCKATILEGGSTAINANKSKQVQDAAFELLKYVRGNKEVMKNQLWPFQKKVDYRPVYLSVFTDLQEDYFSITGLDPAYAKRMEALIINPVPPLDIGYGDPAAYLSAAFQAVMIKNADPKSELDKAADAITKELMASANQQIIDEKFYKEMKDKEDEK